MESNNTSLLNCDPIYSTEFSTLSDPFARCMYNRCWRIIENQFVSIRFSIAFIIGLSVSLIGIVFTLFLLKTFYNIRKSSILYLACLALLDLAIIVDYILIMSFGVAKEFFHNYTLHYYWIHYAKALFTIGKITQFAQCYLIIAATFERFLLIFIPNYDKLRSNGDRILNNTKVCAGVMLFAIAAKLYTYWEQEISFAPGCQGFARYYIRHSPLSEDSSIYWNFKYYGEPTLQVYIPFAILVTLNCAIVVRLHGILQARKDYTIVASKSRKQLLAKQAAETQNEVKNATKTMIALVSFYLLSNTLNFVITIMEQVKSPILANIKFYMIASEMSSLFVILTCMVRLPVYCACNREIRKHVSNIAFGYPIVSKRSIDALELVESSNRNQQNGAIGVACETNASIESLADILNQKKNSKRRCSPHRPNTAVLLAGISDRLLNH